MKWSVPLKSSEAIDGCLGDFCKAFIKLRRLGKLSRWWRAYLLVKRRVYFGVVELCLHWCHFWSTRARWRQNDVLVRPNDGNWIDGERERTITARWRNRCLGFRVVCCRKEKVKKLGKLLKVQAKFTRVCIATMTSRSSRRHPKRWIFGVIRCRAANVAIKRSWTPGHWTFVVERHSAMNEHLVAVKQRLVTR